jgi:hypothetical protein
MFAGSFRGRTQTMPLAIYGALESDLGAALALGTILVGVSVAVLALVRLVTGPRAAAASAVTAAGDARAGDRSAAIPPDRAAPGRPDVAPSWRPPSDARDAGG